ncbi:hypothetical protein AB0C27_51995 [Nonomuraea sp. NPDC048882]|uniref:hypothetical protein n=1 Tax=unclassified Nonomuraea TaxID=2593643 RepID=UPI0033FAFE95
MGDWLSCAQAAVTVAGEEGDATARAAALLVLASAHTHRGQPDAISLYSQALSLADQGDWKEGMSSIRNNLAGTYLAPGATG